MRALMLALAVLTAGAVSQPASFCPSPWGCYAPGKACPPAWQCSSPAQRWNHPDCKRCRQ